MRNLIKRLRMDKNGKLVTRHVKPEGETKPIASIPAVSAPIQTPMYRSWDIQGELSKDMDDIHSILDTVLDSGSFVGARDVHDVRVNVDSALNSLEAKTVEVFAKSLRDNRDDSHFITESIHHIISVGRKEVVDQTEREVRSIFAHRSHLPKEMDITLVLDVIGYTMDYEEFDGVEPCDLTGESRAYFRNLLAVKNAFHVAIVNGVGLEKGRNFYDDTVTPLKKEMRQLVYSRPGDIERITELILKRGSTATPDSIEEALNTASASLQEGAL